MPAENQHLTLKFLGEIHEGHVDRLVERARREGRERRRPSRSRSPASARSRARARRACSGSGSPQGAGALAKLARKLDAAARVAGAERERRPFAAHLTLGRLREPARIELERLVPPESVAWTVAEVVLYESRLAPGGARYVPLAHLPLGAGEGDSNDEFAPET